MKEVGVPNPDTFTADMAGAFYRLAAADAFTALDNVETMLPDLERHRYDDEEQEVSLMRPPPLGELAPRAVRRRLAMIG